MRCSGRRPCRAMRQRPFADWRTMRLELPVRAAACCVLLRQCHLLLPSTVTALACTVEHAHVASRRRPPPPLARHFG
jgi:hypothetical protein